MKKLVLSFLCLILYAVSFAQISSETEKPIIDRNIGKNEIKLNFLAAFVGTFDSGMELYFPEVTYERVIDDGFTVGISAWRMAPEIDFIIVPHVRVYSGKKNNGFFLEFNTAVLKADYDYQMGHGSPQQQFVEKPTKKVGKGFGLAFGGKFLIGNGFVMETYLGLGKSKVMHEGHKGIFYYPRFGITMGQRF
jgi:hypothetical protein